MREELLFHEGSTLSVQSTIRESQDSSSLLMGEHHPMEASNRLAQMTTDNGEGG